MARIRKVKAGRRKSIRRVKMRQFGKTKPAGRMRFEKLLTDISLRFISLPADRIDDEIMVVQKSICGLLNLDICALWQFSPDAPDSLKTTHVYTTPDFLVEVPEGLDAKEIFPWCLETVKNKKNVVLSRVQDAPVEAARDLESFKHFSVKSSLIFPLFVGDGKVFGALSWNTWRNEKDWTEELINRLLIVSQVLANALSRKFTEEKLKESEKRYRMLFESAPEGVLLIGADGYVKAANLHQAQMYGYKSAGELKGLYAPLFVAPQDRQKAAQNMKNILDGNELVAREYTAVRRDGTEFLVEVSSVILRGPKQEVQGYLCITRDITRIKQDENDRVQLRNELAHLSRIAVINELSASLAHEINQPLGAILNNASAAKILALKHKDLPDDIDEILSDIVRDAKRAGDVIRKIKGLVKKQEAPQELVNINDIIQNVLSIFQNSFSLNRISCVLELSQRSLEVEGDRVRLQQVLANLISNAMDAMRESPTKVLKIRSDLKPSDTVLVSVHDSGRGIDDAAKDIIFQSFYTTKKSGLGLGLSICKSIIEDHGGRIWAERHAEGGTTLWFSLKAAKSEKS